MTATYDIHDIIRLLSGAIKCHEEAQRSNEPYRFAVAAGCMAAKIEIALAVAKDLAKTKPTKEEPCSYSPASAENQSSLAATSP